MLINHSCLGSPTIWVYNSYEAFHKLKWYEGKKQLIYVEICEHSQTQENPLLGLSDTLDTPC